ncbi:MAG TPA: DUF5597 domain-containing protein [Acidisarcina sp.]
MTFKISIALASLIAVNVTAFIGNAAETSSAEMPRIVQQDGRYALLVDGHPYLMLGGQIGNSSSWPAVLPQVWSSLEAMHANTAETPVYWEVIEPTPGKFDFSMVDALLAGAREHHLHLVLLWFGTWKNGNMHYVPEWIKTDTVHYPRMINRQGEPIDVLSANSKENLAADKHAFAALMKHLRVADGTQHTVLMIQVENESGGVGSVRDFSPMAEEQFQQNVPDALVTGLHKSAGTWKQVFGGDADEYFQAYYQSSYINEVAMAGKAEYPLPMYINVWLSYPVAELPERRIPNPGIGYPSGGAVQKMVDLWKINAPAIDLIAPDMYSDDSGFYRSVLDTYRRPDNALMIPECGRGDSYARYFFYALGRGTIGFAPFGVDRVGWGVTASTQASADDAPKGHAENFALISPMDGLIAKLNFEGKLKTAVEEPGEAQQEIDFGPWQATASFGFPQPDGRRPPGTTGNVGRVLIAQLGPDEFLVTGFQVSVAFHQPGRLPGLRSQILRAEEGSYDQGVWHMTRLLNGDQTDRGLQFRDHPVVVRIRIGRF